MTDYIHIYINDKFIDNYRQLQNETIDMEIQLKINEIIKYLKSFSPIRSLIIEISKKFYVELLNEKINSQYNIFSVENCVIQLYENTIWYRHENPKDYITHPIKVIWNDKLYPEHPYIKEVDTFLKISFINKETCDYSLKVILSHLLNRNHKYSSYYIWTGNNKIIRNIMFNITKYLFETKEYNKFLFHTENIAFNESYD